LNRSSFAGKPWNLALRTSHSEPVTSVRDPPTDNTHRYGRHQGPPQRQDEVCGEAKKCENYPEDFAFHSSIVGLKKEPHFGCFGTRHYSSSTSQKYDFHGMGCAKLQEILKDCNFRNLRFAEELVHLIRCWTATCKHSLDANIPTERSVLRYVYIWTQCSTIFPQDKTARKPVGNYDFRLFFK
jgi:hypothetical protein